MVQWITKLEIVTIHYAVLLDTFKGDSSHQLNEWSQPFQ